MLLFILRAFVVQGQVLTVGEVYDYEIGDIFQIRYDAVVGAPPTFITDTVVAKTLYSAGDSVNYMIHRVTYSPYYGPNQEPHFTDNVFSVSYTSLGDTALQGQYLSSCPIVDTFYQNSEYCGQAKWVLSTDSCLGPDYGEWWLIAGCGGLYYDTYNDGTGHVSHLYLEYFKKGALECGTSHSIPLGIAELRSHEARLSVNPVPSADRVYLNLESEGLKFSSGRVRVDILDQYGHAVKHADVDAGEVNGYQLDIHELPAGVYMLNLADTDQVLTRTKLVKL